MANVGMWIGLTQLLTLLNVLCRSLIFDIRVVQLGREALGRGGTKTSVPLTPIAPQLSCCDLIAIPFCDGS